MALFRRKERVVDLTEKYEKQQEQINSMKEKANKESQNSEQQGSIFPFFVPSDSKSETDTESKDDSEEYLDIASDVREKRKKLAKRIGNMTEKMGDLSNQIYHLQQRIEVLEKKSQVRFD